MSAFARATASGPRVARLYALVLSVAWLVAWWSLGVQILALYGERGVAPARQWLASALATGSPTFWQAPSLLWLGCSDTALIALVVVGIGASVAAIGGLWPRRALLLCGLLYMSIAAVGGPFFPMLGDKLLLEATLVALVLPRRSPSPWAHWLARLLVVKLYLHVGASQWLAPHNEWQQGSALASFFVTTPLPTPAGWWADHLPAAVLSLLTKMTLLIEVFAPFCLLGPRPLRLAAAAALTALQAAALVLANYGLFAFVAVGLHLFFLDERDVDAMQHDVQRLSPLLARGLRRLLAGPYPRHHVPRVPGAAQALHVAVLGVYASLALSGFWQARHRFEGLTSALAPLERLLGRWQLLHAYTHLQSPAAQRAEPLFERLVDGQWQPIELWRQPSDLWRAPSFVAPHLPRLDAALSVWGQHLYADAHGAPAPVAPTAWAERMLRELCRPHPGFARLLRTPVTRPAQSVRLILYRYDVPDAAVHEQAGLWWTRAQLATLAQIDCASGQWLAPSEATSP